MAKKKYKLEKDFQSDVISFLTQIGFFVFKCESQTRGIPDLFCIRGGVHIFIEIKLPSGKLSKIQSLMIERINERGGNAFVAYDMEDIHGIIKEMF